MEIFSPSFENNGVIPSIYTCDGGNFNPPLIFRDVPLKTKSLALIMDDPDAPFGAWTHWLLWNIRPDTKEIRENSKPIEAVEGITSFDTTGYGGPCPPSGQHRYFFKLYALDIKLDLSQAADRETLENIIRGHIIERAKLIGTYDRDPQPRSDLAD